MYRLLIILFLSSCSVIEDYKIIGEEKISGTIEYDFQIHEHFCHNDTNSCFYYHDTLVENWELTIDNIIKTRKIVWKKR